MITRNDLKQLSEAAISERGLNSEVVEFVLARLSRGELSRFFLYFEKQLRARSASVTSARPLSSKIKASLKKIFSGRLVFFDEDARLGEGIRVSIGDTGLDLSLAGYIDNAFNELRKR